MVLELYNHFTIMTLDIYYVCIPSSNVHSAPAVFITLMHYIYVVFHIHIYVCVYLHTFIPYMRTYVHKEINVLFTPLLVSS